MIANMQPDTNLIHLMSFGFWCLTFLVILRPNWAKSMLFGPLSKHHHLNRNTVTLIFPRSFRFIKITIHGGMSSMCEQFS